jgi:hypothetical protein
MSLPRNDYADAKAAMIALIIKLKVKKNANAPLAEVEKTIHYSFNIFLKSTRKGRSNLGLYLELEKNIEPEALEKNLGTDILNYLKEIKGLNSPKKILQSFDIKPSGLKEFTRNPVSFLRHIVYVNTQTLPIKLELDQAKADSSFTTTFKKEDLELFDREAASLPSGFNQMNKLYKNLDRYFQPLQFLAQLANFFVVMPLFLVVSLVAAIKRIVTYIVKDWILDWGLVNTLAGGLYEKAVINYQDANYDAAKKYFLDYQRLRDKHFLNLSNDELISTLAEIDVRNRMYKGIHYENHVINQTVEDSLQLKGSLYVKFVAKALYDKLFNDAPAEDPMQRYLQLIAWPFRLLAALPVLAIATIAEGINRLADYSILALAVTGTFITAAGLLTLNVPLMIWDAPKFIYDKVKNGFSSKNEIQRVENDDEDEHDALLQQDVHSPHGQSSYHRLLGEDGLLMTGEEKKHEPKPTSPLLSFPSLPARASVASTIVLSSSSLVPESKREDYDEHDSALGLRR